MAILAGVAMASGCASIEPAAGDEPDPRCETMPMLLDVHPHAPAQPREVGRDLIDTRGWHGRLYFGYGDLENNTGPIVVSSYDPVSRTWIDHFTFQTERIERFRPIGDRLFAPAADPKCLDLPDCVAPQPDYAVGTASHAWGAGGIDLGTSLHLMDATERVPGDVYLTGSDFVDVPRFLTSAAVWRSVDGGPFTKIFPKIDPVPSNPQDQQLDSGFLNTASLGGKVYVGLGWEFDGQTWLHSAVELGEFMHPTTFANRIVSSTLGELWAFDGKRMTNLGVRLWDTPALYQVTLTPLAIFQETEGHLVAVNAEGSVITTTDLVTWSCIGKAPPDVRSIGSLGGTMYFGGPAGRVYGFPSPSW